MLTLNRVDAESTTIVDVPIDEVAYGGASFHWWLMTPNGQAVCITNTYAMQGCLLLTLRVRIADDWIDGKYKLFLTTNMELVVTLPVFITNPYGHANTIDRMHRHLEPIGLDNIMETRKGVFMLDTMTAPLLYCMRALEAAGRSHSGGQFRQFEHVHQLGGPFSITLFAALSGSAEVEFNEEVCWACYELFRAIDKPHHVHYVNVTTQRSDVVVCAFPVISRPNPDRSCDVIVPFVYWASSVADWMDAADKQPINAFTFAKDMFKQPWIHLPVISKDSEPTFRYHVASHPIRPNAAMDRASVMRRFFV